MLSGNLEVLDGTHGLYTIVGIIRNLQFTEKIVFNTHCDLLCKKTHII